MNDFFLSCDWGTSSLRLRLMEADTGNILGEIITDNGIAKVYDKWTKLEKKTNRLFFFQTSLAESIASLEARCNLSCKGLTLIISGMASSSIGMLELPYAQLPLPLSNKVLPKHFFPEQKEFPYHIVILSGLRTENDVMRGEETELIGLVEGTGDTFEEGHYIFPGTHSKHVAVKNQEITGFHTFMTGELFDLLTDKSTLKASVRRPEKFDGTCRDAFTEGVVQSQKHNFLSGLFKTRTNQLLNRLDLHQNYYYLSGLITGLELAEVKSYEKTVICAGPKFEEPYQLGIDVLGLSAKCRFIPASEVALLVCKGHYEVYKNLNLKR